MQKYRIIIAGGGWLLLTCLPVTVFGVMPSNGDFETGAQAPEWGSASLYPGYDPAVFSGTPLPSYPDLTPYQGEYSLMFYRDDGVWSGPPQSNPDWYHVASTTQTYPVAPGTYTFQVAAAGFVHHDRYEEQTEDPWGAGIQLNIYIGAEKVYLHDWWPSQAGGTVDVDGQWVYSTAHDNYLTPPAEDRQNTTVEVTSPSDATVEIVWMSKWDTDLDAMAIDAIGITGLPMVPEPSVLVLAAVGAAGAAWRRRRSME